MVVSENNHIISWNHQNSSPKHMLNIEVFPPSLKYTRYKCNLCNYIPPYCKRAVFPFHSKRRLLQLEWSAKNMEEKNVISCNRRSVLIQTLGLFSHFFFFSFFFYKNKVTLWIGVKKQEFASGGKRPFTNHRGLSSNPASLNGLWFK